MGRPALPAGLYAIADAGFGDPVRTGRALLVAGCAVVQVRAKGWTEAALVTAARTLVSIADDHGALVIVNDSPAAARDAGASGVHLGQDDGSTAVARTIVGPDALIGRSTHEMDQVRHAGEVDYIGFGPIFATKTKTGTWPARGVDGLRAAVHSSPVPVVAIGGIGPKNLDSVRATGCHGWAVISALLGAGSVHEAVQILRRGSGTHLR
jgi:thiamine-phosphate pyrophosphorylase